MDRIASRGEDNYELATITLALISASPRPLKWDELQQCIAIQQGEDPSDADTLTDLKTITASCGDFLVTDPAVQTITLAHHTMWTFLEKNLDVERVKLKTEPLNERLPGLFSAKQTVVETPTIRNEDLADLDEVGSAWGSDAFSQYKGDETLVPSMSLSISAGPIPASIKALSVPDQLVRLFLTDEALPNLVNNSLDVIGSARFERNFSALLKAYSLDLEAIAEKPSQKTAAVVAGQKTHQTASRLCLAMRPQDVLNQLQNSTTLNMDAAKQEILDRFLAMQDTPAVLHSSRNVPVPPKGQGSSGEKLQRSVDDMESIGGIGGRTEDEDIGEVYANIETMKHFLIHTMPFAKLKFSLAKQISPEHGSEPTPEITQFVTAPDPLEKSSLEPIWVDIEPSPTIPADLPAPPQQPLDLGPALILAFLGYFILDWSSKYFNLTPFVILITGAVVVLGDELRTGFMLTRELRHILQHHGINFGRLSLKTLDWMDPIRNWFEPPPPPLEHQSGLTTFSWTCVSFPLPTTSWYQVRRICEALTYLVELWKDYYRYRSRTCPRRCRRMGQGYHRR
jgi:hypothetical protein